MKHYARTCSLGLLLYVSATAALGANRIQTPEYVNLYWDSTWDTDNPSMPKASIDAFTTAMVASTYFAGLQEYGVTNASFGGGFLPTIGGSLPLNCQQRAPKSPGFWDPLPSNPSIMAFLQCEMDHGGVPKGPNVIYNIILPPYAIESDAFGALKFCQATPGNPTAWHFHGNPGDVRLTTILTGLTLGLSDLLDVMANVLGSNGPVWTVIMTAPACNSLPNSFTGNLLHEMVEAAANPYPSVHTIFYQKEIADVCENAPTSSPFATPVLATQVLAGGNASPPFTTQISAPSYRSDMKRGCIAGYSDQTVPTGVTMTLNGGQGGTASMTIKGSGFGTLPPVFAGGNEVSSPYIAIQDVAQGWQAGNVLNGDGHNGFTVGISNWSPNGIIINGIGNPGTSFTMRSGDPLSMWICDPASGQCAAASKISMPPGPYLPNLAFMLVLEDVQHLAPYVTFTIDGNPGGDCLETGTRARGSRWGLARTR